MAKLVVLLGVLLIVAVLAGIIIYVKSDQSLPAQIARYERAELHAINKASKFSKRNQIAKAEVYTEKAAYLAAQRRSLQSIHSAAARGLTQPKE